MYGSPPPEHKVIRIRAKIVPKLEKAFEALKKKATYRDRVIEGRWSEWTWTDKLNLIASFVLKQHPGSGTHKKKGGKAKKARRRAR